MPAHARMKAADPPRERRSRTSRRQPRRIPSLFVSPSRLEAGREPFKAVETLAEAVLRAKSPDEARTVLHQHQEAVGLMLVLGLSHIFSGYDGNVVLSATSEGTMKAFARTKVLSAHAFAKAQQALDLSCLARKDLLEIVSAKPPEAPVNAEEIQRSLVALTCIECVVCGAAFGHVRARSRAILDAVVEEYEQAALALYRAVRSVRRSERSPGTPSVETSPQHEATASKWLASKDRRLARIGLRGGRA